MDSKLRKQLSNENIEIIYSNLNNDVAGCYYSIDGLDIIVINEPMILDTKQLNCVIAEELGHYHTTKGNYGPYSCNDSSDKINHSRVEVRAMKWAVDFLVPTNELLKFFSTNGEIHLSDLSNHFEVTSDFIMQKIYYMSLLKNQYQLSNNRYFVVSNYPNAFIYEDFNERSIEYGHSTKAR